MISNKNKFSFVKWFQDYHKFSLETFQGLLEMLYFSRAYYLNTTSSYVSL